MPRMAVGGGAYRDAVEVLDVVVIVFNETERSLRDCRGRP